MLGEFVDLKTMVGSRRVADRPQDAILPTNPALDAGFTTPSSGTRVLVVWVHGCQADPLLSTALAVPAGFLSITSARAPTQAAWEPRTKSGGARRRRRSPPTRRLTPPGCRAGCRWGGRPARYTNTALMLAHHDRCSAPRFLPPIGQVAAEEELQGMQAVLDQREAQILSELNHLEGAVVPGGLGQ